MMPPNFHQLLIAADRAYVLRHRGKPAVVADGLTPDEALALAAVDRDQLADRLGLVQDPGHGLMTKRVVWRGFADWQWSVERNGTVLVGPYSAAREDWAWTRAHAAYLALLNGRPLPWRVRARLAIRKAVGR